MKEIFLIGLLFFLRIHSFAQSPCENGIADSMYPCNQITMLSHMSPDELMAVEHRTYFLNDLWGWTDETTDKEYGIIGLKDGVVFVDVTVPTSPLLLGKLQEPSTANNGRILHGKSTWRDIKVFKNHAFIVSDINNAHGMQVFDLTKLRELDGMNLPTLTDDFHYTAVGSAHNIVINEETGFAYIVGTSNGDTTCEGGLHMVDINEPKAPQFVGCFSEDGYTHDAQCVTYNGPDTKYQGRELCFNSNEDTFTIVDVEEKDSPTMIAREPYENSNYAHQGWLTEDHRYFLMNDELDELRGGGIHPRTLIWDIQNLEKPQLIGQYHNVEPGVDHNLYTHQGLVFESNYQTGLRVLSTTNIDNGQLREVAFFDTYPEANEMAFGGSWSNYPYFESGTILVSDMDNGLFILKLDLSDDPIISHPQDTDECGTGGVKFELETTNAEDLAYQWQSFDGITYENLSNESGITGTNSTQLRVSDTSEKLKSQFRCKVQNGNKETFYTYLAETSVDSPATNIEASFTYSVDTIRSLVIFNNTSTNADTFLWNFMDSTSEEKNPILSFENEGSIEVMLTAYLGCSFDSYTAAVYFAPLGISLKEEEPVLVYPNPASDYIRLKVQSPSKVEISNISGQILIIQNINQDNNQVPIPNLPSGVYHVQITESSGRSISRAKIIVR